MISCVIITDYSCTIFKLAKLIDTIPFSISIVPKHGLSYSSLGPAILTTLFITRARTRSKLPSTGTLCEILGPAKFSPDPRPVFW